MPTTRRNPATSGSALRGAQSKISFGSRVTKPGSLRGKSVGAKASKDVDKIESASLTSTLEDVDRKEEGLTSSATAYPEPAGHVSSEAVVAKQARIELGRIGSAGQGNKSAEEVRAAKVSDAQIRRYWNDRENERIAKRVHQESVAMEEKILRLFDMTSTYGPCVGIARMKRWVRANKLGLEPPIEVLAVLLKEEKKGNSKIERAYVDDLMSSKLGGSEV